MSRLTQEQWIQLQNWIAATGELYVDIHLPHSGSSPTAYFVHSIDDIERLLSEQTAPEFVATVFRHLKYPLRGAPDATLLAQALRQIPDGKWFHIVSLEHVYPSACVWRGSGNTHAELRSEFSQLLNERVGIGNDPFDNPSGAHDLNPDEAMTITGREEDKS